MFTEEPVMMTEDSINENDEMITEQESDDENIISKPNFPALSAVNAAVILISVHFLCSR
jgi:hypothetical protein